MIVFWRWLLSHGSLTFTFPFEFGEVLAKGLSLNVYNVHNDLITHLILATTTFPLPGAGPARWEEGNRVCWTVYFSSDSVLDVCYQKNNLLSSFAPSNSTPCRLGASVGRSASALLDRRKQRQLCSTSSSRFRSQLSRAHLLINEQMNKALNEWINA